ncbi:hypothetical protein LC605_16000 [Nostoc sp. CHAB 5836]|uniref:hypothetical protein n=1 Tax=Nostoc sp. CHAB 5836 TaxID=2780404 RepID=UPI001E2BF541|nr:hypothetical protein [Nostoc sp. CHAB 5836]MCC5616548.1 hypothetical protein [Nostoc sp. CHAB 5836]
MRPNLAFVLPILLSLLQPAVAEQPRWLKIADNSESTTFLDTEYLLKVNRFTFVQTIEQLNQISEDNTAKQIIKYLFICGRRLGTIQSITKIDSSDVVLDYVINQELNKLTKVVDQSVGGIAYKYACPNS